MARQAGSHMVMVKSGAIATHAEPDHRQLAPGTLRQLIRAAGVRVELVLQFAELE